MITPKVSIAISASLKVDDLRVLVRSTETVPDTANRMDQRIGLLTVDLAAHTPHIDVDDIRRRIEMQIPDVLQQHRPGHDAAFVPDQILQQLKFPRKKKNVLAVPAGAPHHQVHPDVAHTQPTLLSASVSASRHRPRPRQQ